jgi:hypothetical protein
MFAVCFSEEALVARINNVANRLHLHPVVIGTGRKRHKIICQTCSMCVWRSAQGSQMALLSITLMLQEARGLVVLHATSASLFLYHDQWWHLSLLHAPDVDRKFHDQLCSNDPVWTIDSTTTDSCGKPYCNFFNFARDRR